MKKYEIEPNKRQNKPKQGKESLSESHKQFELAKTQFLNKVSHELRTPLSVIKMQIEAIEDGMYENNNKAFQQLRGKLEQFEKLMDKMTKSK
ncbi:MAG: HAMP domain-containing histidine kinase [Alcanivoracaceae bacterium]|nr:HAMP domain-containing histidine kinase [Alcanivoracaceae bacterium]